MSFPGIPTHTNFQKTLKKAQSKLEKPSNSGNFTTLNPEIFTKTELNKEKHFN
jgi:hypothetical protein